MAGAVILLLTTASCYYDSEPSVRYLPLGDARRYVEGEHHYTISLELTKSGRAPDEVGAQTTRLKMDLRELVSTHDGRPTDVRLTVASATAEGADAEAERDAAVGRFITIEPKDTSWEISFGGGALGTEGQVRAADLALIAHLMAPTEPKRPPAAGGSMPEHAILRTGWSTRRLELTGLSTLTEVRDERGRQVSAYQGNFDAEAYVSLRVGSTPAPTEGEVANAQAAAFVAAPLVCLFFLVVPCLIPGVYSSLIQAPRPTVDMNGPLHIDQQALVHRDTGRLLKVEGTGSAQIGGAMPKINLSRTTPAVARQLSGSEVGLDLSWTFTEELADRWPRDPLPRAPIYVAMALIGLVTIFDLAVALGRRRRPSF